MMTYIQRIAAIPCSPLYCPAQPGLVKWRKRVVVLGHNSCHNSQSGELPAAFSRRVQTHPCDWLHTDVVVSFQWLLEAYRLHCDNSTHCFNDVTAEEAVKTVASIIHCYWSSVTPAFTEAQFSTPLPDEAVILGESVNVLLHGHYSKFEDGGKTAVLTSELHKQGKLNLIQLHLNEINNMTSTSKT